MRTRNPIAMRFAAARDAGAVRDWLAREGIRILNVAGPREGAAPGIHDEALGFVQIVLAP